MRHRPENDQRNVEPRIIEPADGSWSSPIDLAKNKDGSLRFCVDYRHACK